jgi:hypothetical protein
MRMYRYTYFLLVVLPLSFKYPASLGGEDGRNGFGGPHGGGPGHAAGNELGIDLSGEIWVETPADGGKFKVKVACVKKPALIKRSFAKKQRYVYR